MKSAVVIIPTIGGDTLPTAAKSVDAQSYGLTYSHIFADSQETDCREVAEYYGNFSTFLGERTGKVGDQRFWGHRVYAASPHLVNQDYVFFLDDDNWYESDHVASLVALCERHKLDFAYSYRNIVDKEGKFICEDRCESLGLIPVWDQTARGYHVDTSAYCFKRDFLIGVSYLWHDGYAADRKFFARVRDVMVTENGVERKVRHGTTGKFTLNYRLGSTDTSANASFFKVGNQTMRFRHPVEQINV
jgi:hypothetical protein